MTVDLERIKLIDQAAITYLSKHRDPRKAYTGHEESHLRNVAHLTELAAIAANFPERDILVLRIPAWMHDFERSNNQINEKLDTYLSAKAALRFCKELSDKGIFEPTLSEKRAIAFSIRANERVPKFFITKPDPAKWSPGQRILGALYIADKAEANGVSVIARRSAFVAGARLQGEGADLPKFGLQAGRNEIDAILLEGAVRLVYINPQSVYPEAVQELIAPLYDVQRDWMHGLLHARGLSIQTYAELVLSTKNGQGRNYIEARKGLISPATPEELAEKITSIGGLTDEGIQNTRGDLADSAVEAVSYFSRNFRRPLGKLIEEWRPKGITAQQWAQSLKDYSSQQWYIRTREQLLTKRLRAL